MEVKQIFAWRLRALLAALPRRRPASRETRRILCLITGGLGDKLMALPAIRHLQREFPGAEMTLIFWGLKPPFFDAEASRVLSVGRSTVTLLREASRGYDVCFVNSIGVFDVRFELAAYLSGAPDLRGPVFPTQSRTVYTRPYIFGAGHETTINLAGAGYTSAQLPVDYLLTLPSRPAGEKTPDVIFHPGSSAAGLTNRWPTESYAAVARALHAKGYSVAAVGTPDEKTLLDSLSSQATGALEVRANLSLDQLTLFLAAARLVIANDSGIGHLAAAAGAPLMTIMGANKPERVAPIGSRVTIIGPRCEYGGCYNNPAVPECHMCINRITPEEIECEALRLLAAG